MPTELSCNAPAKQDLLGSPVWNVPCTQPASITTTGLPHLKDVLNDLLLIMESCLQLLHIELEQVQRGGACGGR